MQTAEIQPLTAAPLTERFVDVGELRLHVIEAGPADGKLVVLLHGFPEFWWTWRHQIPALAAAGYRVVAPDMRGYNLSDKPYAVDAYRLENLVGDVAGLIRALGRERAHVVGHDWGGIVAWELAMRRPEMLDRLAILGAPTPRDIFEGLRRPAQLKRIWYALVFQLPRVPEKLLAKDDFAALRKTFRASPRADVERYVEAAKRARNLEGAINYYRAALRTALKRPPSYRPVPAPTLVLWGEKEAYFGEEMMRPDARWVPNARVETIPGASHWVQTDAPEKVNELLIHHLRGESGERR